MQASYRWLMAVRVAVAVLGGFLWISTAGALAALLLTQSGAVPRAQAVHVMTQLSYVVWCALAMWVFYQPRLARVAFILFGSSLVMYGLHAVLR